MTNILLIFQIPDRNREVYNSSYRMPWHFGKAEQLLICGRLTINSHTSSFIGALQIVSSPAPNSATAKYFVLFIIFFPKTIWADFLGAEDSL